MRTGFGCLAALSLIVVASAATAKEAMIRCVVSAQVTTASKALDDSVNGRRTEATRHYVLDDSRKVIWSVIDGKRRMACDPSETADCRVGFSQTAIFVNENKLLPNGWASATSTNIDRLTGALSETFDARNEKEQTIIHFDMKGLCSPESLAERKF